jgi:hypothetical protein
MLIDTYFHLMWRYFMVVIWVALGWSGDVYFFCLLYLALTQEKIFICWDLWEGCVAPFWGFGEKEKNISGVNVLSIPVKISWVHLWGNVGLWKKIQLVNVKWNYDNLKRGGLKRFDPLYVQSYFFFLII